MTTAELERIEDTDESAGTEVEAEPVEQLSVKDAKALDRKIRSASDKVTNGVNTLYELLEEAARGQIHVTLNYPSWTAYVKDAVQIHIADRIERKELVRILSGKGMSQRAIAGVLGVGQKTVDRDLEGEQFDDDTVTALDNRKVKRQKKSKGDDDAEEPIDVDEVDLPEESETSSAATAMQIIDDFSDELANLYNVTSVMNDLMAEDKWPNARKRIARKCLAKLNEYTEFLISVSADLEGSGEE